MAKDLIIGGASGYDWNQLRYWVNSIKKTRFQGDIVIVATNMSGETVNKLVEHDVKVYAYGERLEDGSIRKSENNIPPHVERFLFIWDYLRKQNDEYRFVTVTDTRDVIFQTDPTEMLEDRLLRDFRASIICSSEGLLYKDEPWGNKNLYDAFGSLIHDQFKTNMIYNVGTIAGFAGDIRDLMLQIFFQSVNRPIPIVDQAVFNFLISLSPLCHEVVKSDNKDGWAIQLGTTLEAVKAGAGDIGLAVKNNPQLINHYLDVYQDAQPVIQGHTITNGDVPFTIVHQWDRVPAIRQIVEDVYGDGKCEQILTIKTN